MTFGAWPKTGTCKRYSDRRTESSVIGYTGPPSRRYVLEASEWYVPEHGCEGRASHGEGCTLFGVAQDEPTILDFFFRSALSLRRSHTPSINNMEAVSA